MTRNRIFAITLALLIGMSAASAQDSLLDYILVECEADIVEFCDRVTPGEGRIAMCMAAYQDQISDRCVVALYEASEVLVAVADAIEYVAESCAEDIKSYCADTPAGDGRILACLEDRGDDVSEECRTAISDVVEE